MIIFVLITLLGLLPFSAKAAGGGAEAADSSSSTPPPEQAQSSVVNEIVDRSTLMGGMSRDKDFASRVAQWISDAYEPTNSETKFDRLAKIIHGHSAWMLIKVVRRFCRWRPPTYSSDDLIFLLSDVAPWLQEFAANCLILRELSQKERVQNCQLLIALGDRESTQAQYHVVAGLVGGKYGFAENFRMLEEYARKGWESAQHHFIAELERENIHPNTFLPYAEAGWNWARFLIVKQERCKELLLEYEQKGWEEARAEISWRIAKGISGFRSDPFELINRAEGGCKKAQELVSEGFTYGLYGLEKNFTKLIEQAKQDWISAQVNVSWGLALGHEFGRNPSLLMECAELGWPEAQKFVCEGIANGWHGFQRDLDNLMALANRGWKSAQKTVALGLFDGEYELIGDNLIVSTIEKSKSEDDLHELYVSLRGLAAKARNQGDYDSPYLEIYCCRVLKTPNFIANFLMDFP